MNRYKVAYIDENPAHIRTFQREIDEELEVLEITPIQDINQFVDNLLALEVDAFVVDFQLNEYRDPNRDPINYNGATLVKMLLDSRHDFPCFILTSYDMRAAEQTRDVNFVYSKEILNPERRIGQLGLAAKIRLQIEHYRSAIRDATEKFYELLEKSEQGLTQDEENELLKLDSYLESTLDNHDALPSERKSEFAIGKIGKLIENSEKLIELLKETNE